MEYNLLEEENSLLRNTIRELELENERLKNSASRIVIENFEGEGRMAPESIWFEGIGTNDSTGVRTGGWHYNVFGTNGSFTAIVV